MSNSIKLYVILCCLFCTIIVTGNLIFQKFIILDLYFFSPIEISVGVFLYPITFLISDLVSEFYGEELAKLMIRSGVICSLMVLLVIIVADQMPATKWSIIDKETFHRVFSAFGISSLASILANYIGQLVDIHIFLKLKLWTRERHLWLRNNVSTIIGQIIDTFTVISILYVASIIPEGEYFKIIYSSLIFKIIAALLDTPFCYLGHYLMNKLT